MNDAQWTAIRSCALAAIVAASLSSCGSPADGNKTVTVESVLSATRGETTSRFSTTIVYLPETRVVSSYAGAEGADGNTSFVLTQPGTRGEMDEVWSGSRLFSRTRTDLPGMSYGWCREQQVTKAQGSGVSPVNTLAALHLSGKILRHIGKDRVRGVETDHYEIVGASPPIDVWVDSHDLLRRLRWTHGPAHQTDTVEIYDYGAPVSIAVPAHAPNCPLIPPGICALGQPLSELPTCPKPTTTTDLRH